MQFSNVAKCLQQMSLCFNFLLLFIHKMSQFSASIEQVFREVFTDLDKILAASIGPSTYVLFLFKPSVNYRKFHQKKKTNTDRTHLFIFLFWFKLQQSVSMFYHTACFTAPMLKPDQMLEVKLGSLLQIQTLLLSSF